jgi:hypothetical protein
VLVHQVTGVVAIDDLSRIEFHISSTLDLPLVDDCYCKFGLLSKQSYEFRLEFSLKGIVDEIQLELK